MILKLIFSKGKQKKLLHLKHKRSSCTTLKKKILHYKQNSKCSKDFLSFFVSTSNFDVVLCALSRTVLIALCQIFLEDLLKLERRNFIKNPATAPCTAPRDHTLTHEPKSSLTGAEVQRGRDLQCGVITSKWGGIHKESTWRFWDERGVRNRSSAFSSVSVCVCACVRSCDCSLNLHWLLNSD